MSFEEDLEFIRYFKEEVIDDLGPMMRELIFKHIVIENFKFFNVLKLEYNCEEFFEIFQKHTNPIELDKFMKLVDINKFCLHKWYYGDYYSNFFIDRFKFKNRKKMKLDKKESKNIRLYMNTLNIE